MSEFDVRHPSHSRRATQRKKKRNETRSSATASYMYDVARQCDRMGASAGSLTFGRPVDWDMKRLARQSLSPVCPTIGPKTVWTLSARLHRQATWVPKDELALARWSLFPCSSLRSSSFWLRSQLTLFLFSLHLVPSAETRWHGNGVNVRSVDRPQPGPRKVARRLVPVQAACMTLTTPFTRSSGASLSSSRRRLSLFLGVACWQAGRAPPASSQCRPTPAPKDPEAREEEPDRSE